MYMSTIEALPYNKVIEDCYPMQEIGYMIRLTNKKLFQKDVEGEVISKEEALEDFISKAPQEANAILGIRTSLTSQSFNNGAFMYLVYSGTPVKMVDMPSILKKG